MGLRYAYNTNGCAHHRLPDALDLIAAAGYDGVALTLDWHHLDPLADDWRERSKRVARLLRERKLGCVIETGARYLLDPARKHEPTLVSPTAEGRARRRDFLMRALDVAGILEAETMSCWAGVRRPEVSEASAWEYLVSGFADVAAHARATGTELSIEPEPGMQIETNADFERLINKLGSDSKGIKLALDLGHVWVTGEMEPVEAIHYYADRLGTISIEGMDKGVHLHLPLDRGDMKIPPLLSALAEVGFERLVCVELSRESPRAHEAIPHSLALLHAYSGENALLL